MPRNNPNRKNLIVRVPDELKQNFTVVSNRLEVSQAVLIKDALKKELEKYNIDAGGLRVL